MRVDSLDWSELSENECAQVRGAMERSERFHGYIPSKAFRFILGNYQQLARLKILETNWMPAYVHSSHFADIPLDLLKAVFDACDRKALQKEYPIEVGDHFSRGERFSLFRGCAGPQHRKGMSWTGSLDKAIWYAAHHVAYYDISKAAVYATVVDRSEIYCCGQHYDFDFIVHPATWWKVEVPAAEFRLDRPR